MTFAGGAVQAALFDLGVPVPVAKVERPAVRQHATDSTAQAEIDLDRLEEAKPGSLPPLASMELRMPATRAECQGPGICPVFRCRYNIALRVKRSGAIKVDGGGPGTTMRPIQRGPEAVERRVNRMVGAILERIERLGTNCVLDLVEQHGRMEIPDVAEALGVTEEIVRLETLEGQHAMEIALKRKARREQAAQTKEAAGTLYHIRKRPTQQRARVAQGPE